MLLLAFDWLSRLLSTETAAMGQVPFAAPYEQRTVRFVEVCKHAHWRIKVYAVLADGREYDAALINAAKERVLPDLPRDDNEWQDHGAAILIVH